MPGARDAPGVGGTLKVPGGYIRSTWRSGSPGSRVQGRGRASARPSEKAPLAKGALSLSSRFPPCPNDMKNDTGRVQAAQPEAAQARPLPWFKFDVIRWRMSERVRSMDYAQRGVYLQLLTDQWWEGSIPADAGQLARLLGLSLEEFEPLWDVVSPAFEPDGSGRLRNARLAQERLDALDASGRQAAKGRASGAARRGKRRPVEQESNRGSTAAEPEPNPLEIEIEIETTTRAGAGEEPPTGGGGGGDPSEGEARNPDRALDAKLLLEGIGLRLSSSTKRAALERRMATYLASHGEVSIRAWVAGVWERAQGHDSPPGWAASVLLESEPASRTLKAAPHSPPCHAPRIPSTDDSRGYAPKPGELMALYKSEVSKNPKQRPRPRLEA